MHAWVTPAHTENCPIISQGSIVSLQYWANSIYQDYTKVTLKLKFIPSNGTEQVISK